MSKYDLIVTFPYLRNGGAEKVVIITARELQKKGLNFKVITLYTDQNVKNDIEIFNHLIVKPSPIVEKILKVRILRYLLSIPIYFYLLFKFRNQTKEFLAFGTFSTYILALIRKFNKNFSIIYFEQDIKIPNKYQFDYKDFYQKLIQFINLYLQDFLDLKLLNEVKSLVTISERELINAKFHYSKIIKNFYMVNPPLSLSNLETTDGNVSPNLKDLFKTNKKFLAVVGAIDEKKNPKECINFLSFLNKKNNDYELIFVGSGDLEQESKNYVKELNLEHKIKFLGNVSFEDRNYVYKNIFCNIFLAKYQSWGITPIEALVYGKPSIVSSESGSSEFFQKNNLNHIHNSGEEYTCCFKFLENECQKFKFDKKILEELYPENYIKKLLSIIF